MSEWELLYTPKKSVFCSFEIEKNQKSIHLSEWNTDNWRAQTLSRLTNYMFVVGLKLLSYVNSLQAPQFRNFKKTWIPIVFQQTWIPIVFKRTWIPIVFQQTWNPIVFQQPIGSRCEGSSEWYSTFTNGPISEAPVRPEADTWKYLRCERKYFQNFQSFRRKGPSWEIVWKLFDKNFFSKIKILLAYWLIITYKIIW